MKNRFNKCGFSAMRKTAALFALTTQLTTAGTLPATAQSSNQIIMNDSLPLPDLNLALLEKAVKTSTAKKAGAQAQAKSPTLPSAPKAAVAAAKSTDPNWMEDSLTGATRPQAKTPTAAIVPQATTPKFEAPSLRGSIPLDNKQPLVSQGSPLNSVSKQQPAVEIGSSNSLVPDDSDIPAPTSQQSSAVAESTINKGDAASKESDKLVETPAAAPSAQVSTNAPAVSSQEASKAGSETTAANSAAQASTQPSETNSGAETASAPAPKSSPENAAEATSAGENTAAAQEQPKPTDAVADKPAESKPEGTKENRPNEVALLTPAAAEHTLLDGVIMIDNDEETEQEQSIEYEALPTDSSGAKVKVGAKFPIVVTSEITSKTAKVGDPVHGRLKYDLKVGDRMVAAKGSVVRGHINYALKARTPMASLVSVNRWYKDSGCLGVAFDEIVNEKGEHIPLVAEPARQALYVKNKGEGRELGINHKGQITGPWSQQLRYKAVRIGMNAALAPAGAFSFGAMPIALGVIGAANPSFAFMKPVGTNVRHRRIKGFFWGALSGVPGSWLIEDTTVKGQEAVIKPGDEFLAEMRKEFTGEPASEAEIMADADMKVKAEVVKNGKKKKSKS